MCLTPAQAIEGLRIAAVINEAMCGNFSRKPVAAGNRGRKCTMHAMPAPTAGFGVIEDLGPVDVTAMYGLSCVSPERLMVAHKPLPHNSADAPTVHL